MYNIEICFFLFFFFILHRVHLCVFVTKDSASQYVKQLLSIFLYELPTIYLKFKISYGKIL